MNDFTERELTERLNLIEHMIAEGRRETESWGWTFVVWGVAYYCAMGLSAWGHNAWAWPATVTIALIATVVGALRTNHHPPTTISKAVGSIWIALAISMFLLFLALGISGRIIDQHSFMAVISAMLGMANGASALMLRWKVQFACAVVWWITAAASCFGPNTQSTLVFLIAIFLCQMLFGVYCMMAEAQLRKRRDPIHA